MQLGPKGEALIKGFETLALVAYPDQGGIMTIGWGHTPASKGQTCTSDQAQTWFLADTGAACRAINSHIDVALTQEQFDALASFVYNVGVGAAVGSTLFRYVNAHVPAAADEFLRWDHVNGQTSAGLLRRRQAERALFLGLGS